MKIVSVEQMRALEAAAFSAGLSEAALQARAGRVVAEEVLCLVSPGQQVTILVGHGNNGRDGAVAASWLVQRNLGVDLVLAPRHAVTEAELAALQHGGARCIAADQTTAVERSLANASLAVDGLAGIGIRGALREPLAGLVQQLNAARRSTGLQVVALDVPSGIDADSGAVPGEAVEADRTVTLGAIKQGLLRFPAAEHVGRLIARGIGIPSEAEQELPYSVLEAAALNTFVPARPLDAHKYRFGRVLVIAGSDHFLGAPVLCAGGAVRVGAGLVTVASTRDVRLNVAAHQPEVTFTQQDIVIEADPVGAVRALEPYLRSHRSVVLGPGLGRGHATTQFVAELLERRPKEHHLVIDADGLFALAEIPDWQRLVDANVVLTPHAGELERLVGHELGTERAAWEEAGALAKAWGCVLVAKGPFTSVAGPDGRVQVWPHANPALATGGTGDVLAGICGSLLAQGCQTVDGACLAVGVHALAAERIVSQRQWRTLVASDLFSELPAVLGELGASRPSDAR